MLTLHNVLFVVAVVLTVLHLIEAKGNSYLGWAVLIGLVLLGGLA